MTNKEKACLLMGMAILDKEIKCIGCKAIAANITHLTTKAMMQDSEYGDEIVEEIDGINAELTPMLEAVGVKVTR